MAQALHGKQGVRSYSQEAGCLIVQHYFRRRRVINSNLYLLRGNGKTFIKSTIPHPDPDT